MGRTTILLAFLTVLLLLTACGKPTEICKSPYIEYKKGECCLDSNNNGICDNDESPQQQAVIPAQEVDITTDTQQYDVYNDAVVYPYIPTAIYNQFPTIGDSLVDFNLTNNRDIAVTVTVISTIQGYTEEERDTVTIPPKSFLMVQQTPLLYPDVAVTEVTTANFYSKVYVVDNPNIVIDEGTLPITLYPRDTMIWTEVVDDTVLDYSHWIVAWVTPHIPEIMELIRIAVEYNPDETMSGYVCPECKTRDDWIYHTNAQVKSLYLALQNEYNVRYVNTPIAFTTLEESSQRVRLPKETLTLSSANCIDGTVLFASALEALGINPIIVLMPEHSIICWEHDPEGEYGISCLETTMIGDYEFEDAWKEGDRQYWEEVDKGNFYSADGTFNVGISRFISVKAFREGIRPIE